MPIDLSETLVIGISATAKAAHHIGVGNLKSS